MAYELTAYIGVGSTPEGSVALPQGAWLLPLLEDAPPPPGLIARVFAEFFGGVGNQQAELYADGQLLREFPAGYSAINLALRELGIVAEPPHDEFDTLGLGRHRHTGQWLAAIAPPTSH